MIVKNHRGMRLVTEDGYRLEDFAERAGWIPEARVLRMIEERERMWQERYNTQCDIFLRAIARRDKELDALRWVRDRAPEVVCS